MHDVNIAMGPFLGVVRESHTLNDYLYLVEARAAMFDDLVWLARTLIRPWPRACL